MHQNRLTFSPRFETPQYHCTGCKANFTVKTGTIMHDSKLSLSKWALAFYLYSTHLKGVSSMKCWQPAKVGHCGTREIRGWTEAS